MFCSGKNKNVIHRPRSVRVRKKCALYLEHGPQPHTQGLGQFFPIQTSGIYVYLDVTELKFQNASNPDINGLF